MRYLGIDYGRKRIGLALSEGIFATPDKVITGGREKLLRLLSTFCKTRRIEKIVIGLPEGAMGKEVRQFAEILQEKVGIPVEFWDETLTSQEALQGMIMIGKKQKKRRKELDSYAACTILQSYLDEKRVEHEKQ